MQQKQKTLKFPEYHNLKILTPNTKDIANFISYDLHLCNYNWQKQMKDNGKSYLVLSACLETHNQKETGGFTIRYFDFKTEKETTQFKVDTPYESYENGFKVISDKDKNPYPWSYCLKPSRVLINLKTYSNQIFHAIGSNNEIDTFNCQHKILETLLIQKYLPSESLYQTNYLCTTRTPNPIRTPHPGLTIWIGGGEGYHWLLQMEKETTLINPWAITYKVDNKTSWIDDKTLDAITEKYGGRPIG